MCREIKDEVNQLWFVAQEYFSLALEEKNKLSKDNLLWTVKDLAAKTKTKEQIKENKSVTLFTAHLASCASRLYSIDENIDEIDISKRISAYYKIKGWRDKIEKIEGEIKRKTHIYIHFLLRHTICHAEIERLENPRFAKVLDEVYKVFLSLTIEEIFNSMQKLMKIMEEELKTIT